MKLILTISLFFTFLQANAPRLSNIPLPKNIFININPIPCDYNCLQQNLLDGNVFTFLTRYQNPDNDEELRDLHQDLLASFTSQKSTFNIDKNSIDIDSSGFFKIAILIPSKKIRKYSKTIPSAILSYLLTNVDNFELKVFDSVDEDISNIQKQVDKIEKEDFKLVIAPYTVKGANHISNLQNDLLFYIPTINKSSVNFEAQNIIFGGINYEQQIKELSYVINENYPISIISDNYSISKSLNAHTYTNFDDIKNIKIIDKNKTNFKYVFNKRDDFNTTNVYLNASIINTSLVLSQLRVYEFFPKSILSTQIAYNKLLFKLTQNADRERFYVANSIAKIDSKLESMNKFLGVDTTYNWVHYSSLIGIDYFYNMFFKDTNSRYFNEEINENQVEYKIDILQAYRGRFRKITIEKNDEQQNENY